MAARLRPVKSLLRASGARARPSMTLRTPAMARWESSSRRPTSSPTEAPGARTESGDSALIRQEGAAEGAPRHHPDYNAAVDYRTS